jgi:transposase InsO family protein
MSAKGKCYDNAVVESFLGHLKENRFGGTTTEQDKKRKEMCLIILNASIIKGGFIAT